MTKPTAPSSAATERLRAWRQARREAGLVKLELWVPETARDDVKATVRAILTDSTRGPHLAGRNLAGAPRRPTSDPLSLIHI